METTFKSTEFPNLDAVLKLIDNWDALPLSEDQRKAIEIDGKKYELLSILKKYIKTRSKKSDGIPMTYKHSKKNPSFPGRLFAQGPSLQGMKRWMRHTIAGDKYHDYDIVNCHPTLCVQYCQKKGWDASSLEAYLVNRDEFLKELMDLNNIDRDAAKDVVLSILNGGSMSFKNLNHTPMWLKLYKVAAEDIHAKILTDPDNYELVQHVKTYKTRNIGGTVMNLLLCKKENAILMSALENLKVKDPVLCSDGFMSVQVFNQDELDQMATFVHQRTGYFTSWIEKPMNEGINLSGFKIIEGKEPDEEMGDFSCATEFLKWCDTKKIEIVSLGKSVAWYNPETGLWNDDLKAIKPFFNECDTVSYQCTESDKKQNAVLSQLVHIIPSDKDWYLNRQSVGFLPLANGVWDFKNRALVDYKPEFGFFYKLKIAWNPDVDTALVDERIFTALFKKDDIPYLKTCLARAIAGHMDKLLFYFVGDGNSGKGLFESAFKAMLGQLVGVINGGSLVSKDSSGDTAKLLSWMVKIKDCVLAYCQEINMDKPLNGVLLKKLSSGGDTIQARINFQDEIEFVLRPLVIIASNDLPAISPSDDALKNRSAYFDMPNVYLDPQQMNTYQGDKTAKPIVTEIKDVWSKEVSAAEALFVILANAYAEAKPEMPQSVVQASEEWMEADCIADQIRDLFEVKEDSKTSSKDLQDAARRRGIHVSAKRLGTIMKCLKFPAEQDRIQGKKAKVHKGISLKLDF